MIAPAQREKRVKIETFRKRSLNDKPLVFSDQKDFTCDQTLNRQIDRHIHCHICEGCCTRIEVSDHLMKYVGASRHPSKVSLLGVVMSDGKKNFLQSGTRAPWTGRSNTGCSPTMFSQLSMLSTDREITFGYKMEPLLIHASWSRSTCRRNWGRRNSGQRQCGH